MKKVQIQATVVMRGELSKVSRINSYNEMVKEFGGNHDELKTHVCSELDRNRDDADEIKAKLEKRR